jgi:glycosyltransferase involved in cell wall biosynthesis
MAKGLAIIATDVGGISEAIEETGVLLPAPLFSDFKYQLADAMVRLVSDKELRLRLGIMAQERARDCFTESHMMSRWCGLIRQLTGDGK